ncbi:hypothetical protein PR202_ga23013 [Eleusine coracana subsp. coracana]|uniref:Serine aminopeptidase S33 domain-containing protein n=1 Tax=Eleusine coracana subsp. coracana TaxID=191504 RepID=A0AAV5D5G0_ELECO|nr:hypothetical protein PR202_ga23013 [Eleusine coracana subsp. coracana]
MQLQHRLPPLVNPIAAIRRGGSFTDVNMLFVFGLLHGERLPLLMTFLSSKLSKQYALPWRGCEGWSKYNQGHGFSEGLQGHIPDIGPVLDDCDAAFAAFRADHPPPLPFFLYGESLGGAIALLLHLRGKDRGLWRDGAVLNGAMCGVSPRFKPPWPLEHLLSAAAAVAPTWRVAFTRGNIPERSFKVEWKRKRKLASPRRTTAPPRAATALELLRVCRELQGRFEEVDLPLLVVHGGEDTVCDPACVEELHRRAGSEDKTLRVYPGMWHQIVGEPEENVEKVFDEIITWLKYRAAKAIANAGKQQ